MHKSCVNVINQTMISFYSESVVRQKHFFQNAYRNEMYANSGTLALFAEVFCKKKDG